MPHIRVGQDQRSTIQPNLVHGQRSSPTRSRHEAPLIHSFDPTHVSLPAYSSKYKNESNAAAIRHLIGGRRRDGGAIN